MKKQARKPTQTTKNQPLEKANKKLEATKNK